MLRSMYAGISGMRGFQTKLDVIGNNISNVNTSGFKKGRVTFQDMISQMTSGAQGATDTRGGVNPSQVGLGSQLSSIDNVHTQGFLELTEKPLDFAIEGDGMFVVQDGSFTAYTRAGNFYLDENGTIVNADGYQLMGYASGDEEGDLTTLSIPSDAESFSVEENGTINYVDENGDLQELGQIALANFSNPEGLEKAGNNLFYESANSGDPMISLPDSEGVGSIVSGMLEMSNVDLAEEFTEMITAQRGFQANTRIITTSDEILQELVNLKR